MFSVEGTTSAKTLRHKQASYYVLGTVRSPMMLARVCEQREMGSQEGDEGQIARGLVSHSRDFGFYSP